MRASMRSWVLLLALIGAASCRQATSVVVRVANAGLVVPGDVASLRIVATNPSVGDSPVYQSSDLRLCGEGERAGCYSFPISVTLRPGPADPEANVRVEVTALDAQGAAVSRDASVFGFTQGESRQVDFTLSPRCLRSDCAAIDRACAMTGACVGLVPVVETPALDMAQPVASEPITLWYRNSYIEYGSSVIAIPPPTGTRPGDLVILLGNYTVAPAGWSQLVQVSLDTRVYMRRAAEGEDLATATYAFAHSASGPPGRWSYIMLVYRGVERVEVGYVSNYVGPYTYPSYAVPRGGSLGLQIPLINVSTCTVDQGPAMLSSPPVFVDTWGPLPAGPSGPRTIDCSSASYGTVQLWLVPR